MGPGPGLGARGAAYLGSEGKNKTLFLAIMGPGRGLGAWGAAYLGSEGKNKPSSSPSWVLGQGWGRGVRPT